MYKVFRKIHLWLSLPLGLVITIICFTGAMLVFEPEITRIIEKDTFYVAEHTGKPLGMEVLMQKVSETLPDSVSITGVTVFADPARTYQVSLSKPARASIFVDQYTGRVTGRYERMPFFDVMFKLHKRLMGKTAAEAGGTQWGKLIVGVSTLLFVLALITGIVIWWPRARKNFGRSLKIFRTPRPLLWKSLHVAGGMWALLLVLAMALTGLNWSFSWYRSGFHALFGVENTPGKYGHAAHKQIDSGHKHEKNHARTAEPFKAWQVAYEALAAQYPNAPQIALQKKSATVTLSDYGNKRATDKYTIEKKTGAVTLDEAYASADKESKMRGWITSVHTGSFGGLATRILWLLAALLGASLPLTGYYIWLRRLGRGKSHDKYQRTKV